MGLSGGGEKVPKYNVLNTEKKNTNNEQIHNLQKFYEIINLWVNV